MRILDCGDSAFTIEFGDAIAPALLDAVEALDRAIAAARARGELEGLIETMPTFRSLTLFFDPLRTGRAALHTALQPLLDGLKAAPTASTPTSRQWSQWCLPVCYEGDAGMDVDASAQALGLSADELVAVHSASEYRVYMLGFLPGFPFMGDLPEALRLPRRREPRVRVPAGSLAIAGALTAVYPWQSPGGWHVLGRCPARLFDAERSSPALLEVGDHVRFTPVSAHEYQRLRTAVLGGELDSTCWRTGGTT